MRYTAKRVPIAGAAGTGRGAEAPTAGGGEEAGIAAGGESTEYDGDWGGMGADGSDDDDAGGGGFGGGWDAPMEDEDGGTGGEDAGATAAAASGGGVEVGADGVAMVAQPTKTAKINIGYAKRAKTVDIKALKEDIWQLLREAPAASPAAANDADDDATPPPRAKGGKKGGGGSREVSFQQVLSRLHERSTLRAQQPPATACPARLVRRAIAPVDSARAPSTFPQVAAPAPHWALSLPFYSTPLATLDAPLRHGIPSVRGSPRRCLTTHTHTHARVSTGAVPANKLEEVSFAYCFICLLHLCNEKGLETRGEGMTDMRITVPDGV